MLSLSVVKNMKEAKLCNPVSGSGTALISVVVLVFVVMSCHVMLLFSPLLLSVIVSSRWLRAGNVTRSKTSTQFNNFMMSLNVRQHCHLSICSYFG